MIIYFYCVCKMSFIKKMAINYQQIIVCGQLHHVTLYVLIKQLKTEIVKLADIWNSHE